MSYDSLQNILIKPDDLEAQDLLKDLYFNDICAYSFIFWKGVKRNSYYKKSRDIIAIKRFLSESEIITISTHSEGLFLMTYTLLSNKITNTSIKIDEVTGNFLKNNSDIKDLLERKILDSTSISVLKDKLGSFDKFINAVIAAQIIEISERHSVSSQFLIPLFTLFVSAISLILSYYSLSNSAASSIMLNLDLAELLRRFFQSINHF